MKKMIYLLLLTFTCIGCKPALAMRPMRPRPQLSPLMEKEQQLEQKRNKLFTNQESQRLLRGERIELNLKFAKQLLSALKKVAKFRATTRMTVAEHARDLKRLNPLIRVLEDRLVSLESGRVSGREAIISMSSINSILGEFHYFSKNMQEKYPGKRGLEQLFRDTIAAQELILDFLGSILKLRTGASQPLDQWEFKELTSLIKQVADGLKTAFDYDYRIHTSDINYMDDMALHSERARDGIQKLQTVQDNLASVAAPPNKPKLISHLDLDKIATCIRDIKAKTGWQNKNTISFLYRFPTETEPLVDKLQELVQALKRGKTPKYRARKEGETRFKANFPERLEQKRKGLFFATQKGQALLQRRFPLSQKFLEEILSTLSKIAAFEPQTRKLESHDSAFAETKRIIRVINSKKSLLPRPQGVSTSGHSINDILETLYKYSKYLKDSYPDDINLNKVLGSIISAQMLFFDLLPFHPLERAASPAEEETTLRFD